MTLHLKPTLHGLQLQPSTAFLEWVAEAAAWVPIAC